MTQPALKHLSPYNAARLPADLDIAAVDELLGLLPPHTWEPILIALAGAQRSTDVSREWAIGMTLRSDDLRYAPVLERIYARREGHGRGEGGSPSSSG